MVLADALTPANKFDVHSIDASHSGILLRVSELADILTDLASTKKIMAATRE